MGLPVLKSALVFLDIRRLKMPSFVTFSVLSIIHEISFILLRSVLCYETQ